MRSNVGYWLTAAPSRSPPFLPNRHALPTWRLTPATKNMSGKLRPKMCLRGSFLLVQEPATPPCVQQLWLHGLPPSASKRLLSFPAGPLNSPNPLLSSPDRSAHQPCSPRLHPCPLSPLPCVCCRRFFDPSRTAPAGQNYVSC